MLLRKYNVVQKATNLIWIDLEMTGLNTDTDYIIEIATIVTDIQLTVLAEGPMLAIHQPDDVLTQMDKWNQTHHSQSGLLDRVRQSQLIAADAEQQTLDFLKQWVPAGKSPMCGNSICQDRRFLHRLMPTLEKYFHYRHIDVSTVKLLAKAWAPTIYNSVNKETQHLALQDIRDSIDELRYYREHLFALPDAKSSS